MKESPPGAMVIACELAVFGASLIALLLLRLWMVLPSRECRVACKSLQRKVRCIVVLGSGGHTAEMLYDLASLRAWPERFQATYLLADTDHGSHAKADAYEAQHGSQGARVVRVPRAREVGQSYATSVLTTARAAWCSLWAVLGELPDAVFANGPGTCVPVVLAAYVARLLGLRRVMVMYSESFACVEHLSLSGRLLYRFADRFTVQWPQLLARYPRAEYAGRLYSPEEVRGCRVGRAPLAPADLPPLPPMVTGEGAHTAVVTVGSTKFDSLISAVDSVEFLAVLWSIGIRKLKVQRGSGQYRPVNLGSDGRCAYKELEVEVLEYTPDLPSELRRAALVISHAGAGTILDCLLAGRRLVVVPNEGLMSNHQVQLAMALQEQRLLFCFRSEELVPGLREADFSSLRCFPEQASPTFARLACEMLGMQPP